MDKKQEARNYLMNVKRNGYIMLLLSVSLIPITFIIMLYAPYLYYLNPMSLFFAGIYAFLLYKKFKFISMIERILNFDESEARIQELYVNLSKDLEKSKMKASYTKKYYMGERSYNRADTNSYLFKQSELKIAKRVHDIFNKK